jgi:hypothetical protein
VDEEDEEDSNEDEEEEDDDDIDINELAELNHRRRILTTSNVTGGMALNHHNPMHHHNLLGGKNNNNHHLMINHQNIDDVDDHELEDQEVDVDVDEANLISMINAKRTHNLAPSEFDHHQPIANLNPSNNANSANVNLLNREKIINDLKNYQKFLNSTGIFDKNKASAKPSNNVNSTVNTNSVNNSSEAAIAFYANQQNQQPGLGN